MASGERKRVREWKRNRVRGREGGKEGKRRGVNVRKGVIERNRRGEGRRWWSAREGGEQDRRVERERKSEIGWR